MTRKLGLTAALTMLVVCVGKVRADSPEGAATKAGDPFDLTVQPVDAAPVKDSRPAIADPLPGQDQWPAVWREIVRVVIEKGKRDYMPTNELHYRHLAAGEIEPPYTPIRTIIKNGLLTPFRMVTVIGGESGSEFTPRGLILRYSSKAVACDFYANLDGDLQYVWERWNCFSRGKGDVVNGGAQHFLEEFKFWKKHLASGKGENSGKSALQR